MSSTKKDIKVYVNYRDEYAEPKIISALKNSGKELTFTNSAKEANFQWAQYEDIDFDEVYKNPKTKLCCSYVIRKALIRKEYLWRTVITYLAKHPDSILSKSVPEAYSLELDYAEFLDDSLMEAYELRQELEENATKNISEKQWYILKPSMCDRAQGIRLFSTIEELQAIFDSFDDEESESEEAGLEEKGDITVAFNNKIVISQIRNFLVQKYISKPLLLDHRKFHIRAYVLATGALSVYLFNEMLCLLARDKYKKPTPDPDLLFSHLSNTCLQGDNVEQSSIRDFWNTSIENKDDIFKSILNIIGDVFEAAATTQGIHFQPLENCFEIFGVDFLVDCESQVYLLEVNSYPDFKQTGKNLSNIIENLFSAVVETAIIPFFESSTKRNVDSKLTLAKKLQLFGFR
ncbi:P-body associated protein Pby1 [Schizosaccharomyces pombe]|uniref:Probable tubulin--tyrosine ligase C12B10.04 n=1 Tax=Schizosaccharomyces pombe (strain 972 / ATCC 24843) TaxID=284812 RepID=TTL_SCHPO|nr:putative tubulin-tyrosine ligase [Schizosaccharomyces pombe]Q10438.1 RecName: Full=Probable tubulin--tyrosine ligase C12B10.04 [Schizosaccharomyces pombe 972h-]CAA94694.1 tubulin-tyrosine ligase (predicted) [Schizosaccharomyces pombe]|eukprot:NP_594636.1 putative tubulin-tyrosine ligase [Schizosaccharomyces pombe]